MNEEIARILQLLEAGKINADEAERLIKAMREPAATSAGKPQAESAEESFTEAVLPEACPNPFRDIEQLFKTVSRAYKSGLKKHRRFEEWRWHEFRRAKQEERRQRSESQSVQDRVRYVVGERAFIDPDSNLEGLDEVGWGLLRYELEEEFGVEIPREDLETIVTVDALVAYIEGRVPQAAKTPPASGPQPPVEPPARPKPGRPRKRASKEDIPAG